MSQKINTLFRNISNEEKQKLLETITIIKLSTNILLNFILIKTLTTKRLFNKNTNKITNLV